MNDSLEYFGNRFNFNFFFINDNISTYIDTKLFNSKFEIRNLYWPTISILLNLNNFLVSIYI